MEGKRTDPLAERVEIDVFDLPPPYPAAVSVGALGRLGHVAELLRLRE
jgi:hypothetical protein